MRSCADIIKLHLKEIGYEDVDCSLNTYLQLAGSAYDQLRVPQNTVTKRSGNI
jgi:hypothetical protein